MQNKDTARAQFDMEQGELSMAKYCVALRKQAEQCVFPDQDDEIRTKILQWREVTLWSHAEELYFEHIIEKRN